MEEIIYKIGGATRPKCTWRQRIWMKLHNLNIIFLRKIILKKLVGSFHFPLGTYIGENFFISSDQIAIGDQTSLGRNMFIIAYAPIKIGHHCSFSFNNKIITSTHDFNDFSTVIAKPVTIGNNVWITTNVTILPGVTIGNNCVIGAGSVVTHDIPSGVFAAGNPCKIIKKIKFSIEKDEVFNSN